jgi:LPS O-antigen subunit length determinant protein (WzzB/FepE family)
MKHNFASLSNSRKVNFNSLYSKTTMNKFKKKNEILTRNILNSKDESNEKSIDTVSDFELEKTHKEKLNDQLRSYTTYGIIGQPVSRN